MPDHSEDPNPPATRICRDCGEEKPLEQFDKNKQCLYGRVPQCKSCKREEARKRRLGEVTRTTNCLDCGTDITDRPPQAKLCIPCGKQRNKDSATKYYQNDPEGAKARIRERWLALPKEERLAKSRVQMLKDHGINQQIYDEMLEAQGGVCKTCKQPETHMYKGVVVQLSVDHDHACCPGKNSCGKCVRGLLCHDCNAALGYFKDDVQRMIAAIDYLESWQLKKSVTPDDND